MDRHFHDVPIVLPRKDLIPWPGLNSRKRFDPEALEELRASIKEIGIGQPIGVTLQEEPPHWIFAGERRWRASEGILEELPVHIRELTDEQAIKMNLTENIQRNALTPMEEAHGLQRYIEKTQKTQTEVAQEIGKTQGWVSGRIRLLRLPEAMQELFDEGAFTHSQARDLLLPFASLPEKKWEAFGKAVGKAMLKTFKKVGRPLTEEELRAPASKTASAMSGWLDLHNYSVDSTDIFPAYVQIPKERWKTAPPGTVINYLYGEYPNSKSSRAFDMEWWEEEMQLAQAERAHEDERRKMELEEGNLGMGNDGRDLEWTPALGPIPIGTPVPHHKRHLVYSPVNPTPPRPFQEHDRLSLGDQQVRRTGNLWADPSMIPLDKLVLQEGEGGGTWNQPAILCTDSGVYEAAVASLNEKRDALVKRRLARQVMVDIEASKKVSLGKAIPSLLALGTTIDAGEDFFTEAAEQLGITPTWLEYQQEHEEELNDFYPFSWAVGIQEYFAGLMPDSLEAIAQLLVYRLTRSPSGSELNIRENITLSVAFELREKLRQELGTMIELPEWKPTPKKGSDDATE